MTVLTQMMQVRKNALNDLRACATQISIQNVQADVCLSDLDLSALGQNETPTGLTTAICDLLDARPGIVAPRYCVLSGLSKFETLEQRRFVHSQLFQEVWQQTRIRHFSETSAEDYKTKTEVIADGQLSERSFGSRWSFKRLHADREALLFSHLYGPCEGFDGGDLVLVDALQFLAQTKMDFDTAFEWSTEVSEGSKPVLRPEWTDLAIETTGVVVQQPSEDVIVFVNNMPEAGILHGVSETAVRDRAAFIRQYHRWSAKAVKPGAPITSGRHRGPRGGAEPNGRQVQE